MLDLTKLIDKYLQGELNETEQTEFETRLKTDPKLQNELDLQQALMKGIERASLSNELLKAKKGYLAKKLLLKIALVLVVAAGTALFVPKLGSKEVPAEIPKKEMSTAPDSFKISTQTDTIIEASGGMVFYIPAYAFDTEADSVDIQIEEALDAASVMMKGLQTFSDSALLETAGMFKFNASVSGEEVALKKQVTASMPTDEIDPDMLLFKGEEDSAGNVNWVNPKKIANPQLKTVDIHSLNFFPSGYLDLTDQFYKIKGINKESKRIYYKMSGWCNSRELKDDRPEQVFVAPADLSITSTTEKDFQDYRKIKSPVNHEFKIPKNYRSGRNYRDSWYDHKENERYKLVSFLDSKDISTTARNTYEVTISKSEISFSLVTLSGKMWHWKQSFIDTLSMNPLQVDSAAVPKKKCKSANCEIDPARIKAIWNAKFNNTLIATREFQERLQFIFTTCKSKYLNTYLNNLDKPMWYSDSLCMLSHSGFRKFYERRDGGVDLENQVQAKLNDYYKEKTRIYQKASAETWKQYKAEVLKKAKTYQTRKQEQAAFNSARRQSNYREELAKNMDNAYRQLGKPNPKNWKSTHKGYILPITTTGWYNVDKYVLESTRNRTTLDYTDPFSGKKAVIEYKKITLKVTNYDQFDFINMYLLPKNLSSFQKIKHLKGTYVKNLNLSFENSVIGVAKKGKQWYWIHIPNAFGKTYDRMMEPINEKVLQRKLARYKWSGTKDIKSDMAFSSYQFNYGQEVKRQRVLERQKQKIAEIIWPCRESGTQVSSESF